MKKQKQAVLVHRVRLGKRQRAPHKTAQSLTQNVVEPFNMTRLPLTFTRRPMLFCGKHLGIRLPEVGEQKAPLVAFRDALPQNAARLLASIPDGVSDDLPRSSALSQPDPTFVSPVVNERPHLVHLQHVTLFGLRQRLLQGRQARGFF